MPSAVRLVLQASHARVLCGERLPVKVIVHNDGDKPLALTAGPANPIVFELRAHPGGPVLHTRSELIALMQMLGDRRKPLPAPLNLVVAAHSSLSRSEDPAAGSSVPIPAGRYALSARWSIGGNDLSSTAVDLVVEAPAADRLVSLFCPLTGSQAQAFDHRADGSTSLQLLLRETESQSADVAAFAGLAEVDLLQGLALAVHVDSGLSGRWLGWLQGPLIGALVGLGGHVSARPLPAKVGLGAPSLAEPVFQRSCAEPTHAIFDWGEALHRILDCRCIFYYIFKIRAAFRVYFNST